MSSQHGGALRKAVKNKAQEGKAINVGTKEGTRQQAALAAHALACASGNSDKKLRARGDASVASNCKEMRVAFDETNNSIADAEVESLKAIKARGRVQARRAAPTRKDLTLLALDLTAPLLKVTASDGAVRQLLREQEGRRGGQASDERAGGGNGKRGGAPQMRRSTHNRAL
eukprot:6191622-Pleurochrysis_carterae.AAC.1